MRSEDRAAATAARSVASTDEVSPNHRPGNVGTKTLTRPIRRMILDLVGIRHGLSIRGRTVSEGRTPRPILRRSMLRRLPTAAMVAMLALAAQSAAGHADSCCATPERDWHPCEIVPPIGDPLTVRLLPDTTPVSIALGRAELRGVAMRLRQRGSA